MWIRAIWNCLKRLCVNLINSALITFIVLGGGIVMVFAISLIFEGIITLMGPDLSNAIGSGLNGHVWWLLGGLVAIVLGFLAWDGVTAEKQRLEAKASAGDEQ